VTTCVKAGRKYSRG